MILNRLACASLLVAVFTAPAGASNNRAPALQYHYRPGEFLQYTLTVHRSARATMTYSDGSGWHANAGPGKWADTFTLVIRNVDRQGMATGTWTFGRSFADPTWCCVAKGQLTVQVRLGPHGKLSDPVRAFLAQMGFQGVLALPAHPLTPGLRWTSHATGSFLPYPDSVYHPAMPLMTTVEHNITGYQRAGNGNGTDVVCHISATVHATSIVSVSSGTARSPAGTFNDSVDGTIQGQMLLNLTYGVLDTVQVHEDLHLIHSAVVPGGGTSEPSARFLEHIVINPTLRLTFGRIPTKGS